MKTIALDAMGGDHAPLVEIEGALAAVKSNRVRVTLVGDQSVLEKALAARKVSHLPIAVHHASQVITMQDSPAHAARRKKDSSMRVAMELVQHKQADAIVSAGNSGAFMACALFTLKRLPGVERPAILTTFPTQKGDAAILDVGANVQCSPNHLLQFAVMGDCFAQKIHQKVKPSIGILSNGQEAHKGTELTRHANFLLSSNSHNLNYLGYIEGRDIFAGKIDVVICDGFSGNLILKVTEGVAELLSSLFKESLRTSLLSRLAAATLAPHLRKMKVRMDYAEQGGAPLLGINGVAIVCHGGSNAKAIKNAILGAAIHSQEHLEEALAQSIQNHSALFDAAKNYLPKEVQEGSTAPAVPIEPSLPGEESSTPANNAVEQSR